MRLGIERYDQAKDRYKQVQIYYNVPENGEYLDYLVQMKIKPGDRIWVDKNKQVCMPCRLRRILTYQFGIQGVEIHEFDD